MIDCRPARFTLADPAGTYHPPSRPCVDDDFLEPGTEPRSLRPGRQPTAPG